MIYDSIVSREPIDKGWSGDRKFRAVTENGEVYLLRITVPEKQARFAVQFQRMQLVTGLVIPMCRPIELGICPEGPYVLHSWVDGEDAEAVIPRLSRDAQYAYGLDAGRILKKNPLPPCPGRCRPLGGAIQSENRPEDPDVCRMSPEISRRRGIS